MGLLFGVLALLGFETVHLNSQPVFGLPGLVMSLVIASLFAVLSAIAMTLGGLLARLVPSLREITITQSDLVGLEADMTLNNID
ncbi:MAG: hypothetical protein EOP20_14680 [Hyphomicrobiales bacterium]|nr:MAG: hypothetical protein EOP20_14680 [Hyphomicrobiales bacterium]